MKFVIILGVFTVMLIESSSASDLIVGTSYNTRLIHQSKLDYVGFPFKKRTKEFFYSDPGQNLIRGIIARDTEHTGAIATITAGGVGFPYVNLRFKSERGSVRLRELSCDRKAGSFLAERISLAMQKGHAASLLGTLPLGNALEDVFYR